MARVPCAQAATPINRKEEGILALADAPREASMDPIIVGAVITAVAQIVAARFSAARQRRMVGGPPPIHPWHTTCNGDAGLISNSRNRDLCTPESARRWSPTRSGYQTDGPFNGGCRNTHASISGSAPIGARPRICQ